MRVEIKEALISYPDIEFRIPLHFALDDWKVIDDIDDKVMEILHNED